MFVWFTKPISRRKENIREGGQKDKVNENFTIGEQTLNTNFSLPVVGVVHDGHPIIMVVRYFFGKNSAKVVQTEHQKVFIKDKYIFFMTGVYYL